MVSVLSKLMEHTMVVADTGDFESIRKYGTRDSTTNPSLIKDACSMPKYEHIFNKSLAYAKSSGKTGEDLVNLCVDHLAVSFGLEILKIVKGRVSTEVDPRLSFDKEGTIERALRIISLYEENQISRERVLIKISATWEGIQAARELEEKHSIHCNLTLIFSLCQAIACAEAKITLISPFIGRINDWYTAKTGKTYSPKEEPGTQKVIDIYNYYKKHGYKTTVMAASLRSVDSVKEIVGIDAITIPPKLLDALELSTDEIEVKLSSELALQTQSEKIELDEKAFRWMMNECPVATEKLADGIRIFHSDTDKLREKIRASL